MSVFPIVSIDVEKERTHLMELMSFCHIIFMNKNFPGIIFPSSCNTVDAIIDMFELPWAVNCSVMVSTMGSNGSVLVKKLSNSESNKTVAIDGWLSSLVNDNYKNFHINARTITKATTNVTVSFEVITCEAFQLPATKIVDTTGAGDAYIGSFLWGLTQQESLQNCMKIGTVVAAEKLQDLGSRRGLPNAEKLNALNRSTEIDVAMHSIYDEMVQEILTILAQNGNNQVLIGIAGPPGVGKSTTAKQLAERLPAAVSVPMDGFHYTKQQLSEFENPTEALARRGAHWTFDSSRLVSMLTELKNNKEGSFPSYVHGGEAVEGGIVITRDHKVVIIEGNYLTLDEAPWDQIVQILHYTYYIEADLEVIEQRIFGRYMSMGRDPEVSKQRIAYNDSPNAQASLNSRHRASRVIQSK